MIVGVFFFWKNSGQPFETTSQYKKVSVSSEDITIIAVEMGINTPHSEASIIIDEEGETTYIAVDFENEHGYADKDNLTTEKIQLLSEVIHKNNFFSLDNNPYNPETDPGDGSTYTISVTTVPADPKLRELADAEIYTVECYEFNCKPKFIEIKELILELWGKPILEIRSL